VARSTTTTLSTPQRTKNDSALTETCDGSAHLQSRELLVGLPNRESKTQGVPDDATMAPKVRHNVRRGNDVPASRQSVDTATSKVRPGGIQIPPSIQQAERFPGRVFREGGVHRTEQRFTDQFQQRPSTERPLDAEFRFQNSGKPERAKERNEKEQSGQFRGQPLAQGKLRGSCANNLVDKRGTRRCCRWTWFERYRQSAPGSDWVERR
jgi:hypothetical protein